MPNLNKIFLAGHLIRDPETKYTQAGTSLCTVGLAVNHRYQVNNEWRQEVCFVDVVGFGKLAEVLKDCRKGQAVVVAGRLDYQTWTTDGGQKRSKHQVRAEVVMPAAGKAERQGEPEPAGAAGSDDIPF